MSAAVSLEGVDVHVVTPEQAEEADMVVCGYPIDPPLFADNIATACAWCGAAIIHRPHAPAKPPKVCFACAVARMEGTVQ